MSLWIASRGKIQIVFLVLAEESLLQIWELTQDLCLDLDEEQLMRATFIDLQVCLGKDLKTNNIWFPSQRYAITKKYS